MRIKNWHIFLLVLIGYNTLVILSNKFIFTEDLYYYSLGNQFTTERIEQLFSFASKLNIVSYVIISLSIIIKLFLITFILYAGAVLSNLTVSIKKIFRVVLQAELLFLFAVFIKFYWIYFFMPDVTLEKIGFFQPLSVINFFAVNEIPKWLVYPLQLINLFELGYWLLLADLLKDVIKKSFWKSFEFVLSTYGVGLLIWAVFVVFLTLNFT